MITPKKSLGQHWLSDERALSEIVASAELGPDETVLEVGPGLGTLTAALLKSAQQVIAVELDPQLAENLRRSRLPNLSVVEEDIRNYDLTHLPANYKLVANIPYYLTSFLLRILFESANPPSVIVVLVQKEVAERLAAKPGDMSLLSVSAQMFGSVSLGGVVKAEMFTPPPKVDSQIVIIKRHDSPLITVDKKQFFRLVNIGFSARRKKLANNLANGLNIDKAVVEAQLNRLGLEPNTRAQELGLESWQNLFKSLEPYL